MPSASMRAVSSSGSTLRLCSPSVTAPSRRSRRARTLAGGRVEGDLVARFDAVAEMRLDLGERQRRGKQDASLRGGAGDLADREEGLARQRRRLIDIGAAPVGEQERSAGAAAPGDAVGIGEREQHAGREIYVASSRDGSLRSPPPLAERVGGGGRAVVGREVLQTRDPPPQPLPATASTRGREQTRRAATSALLSPRSAPSASPWRARPGRGENDRAADCRGDGRDRRRCRQARARSAPPRYRRRCPPRPAPPRRPPCGRCAAAAAVAAAPCPHR